MKAIFVILTIMVASPYSPPAKLKFKYLRTGTQLYMSVTGFAPDSGDAVLFFLKDTLRKIKFDLIDKKKITEISKQNLAEMKLEMTRITELIRTDKIDANGIKAQMSHMGGTPNQSLTIQYTSVTGPTVSFADCDSVGFSYRIFPFREGQITFTRVMWSTDEIGSRTPDSIALFILRKL